MFLCDADGVPIEPAFPGHADRVIYFPRYHIAFIYDSKFGRNEVPKADINLQLRCYAVMFAENFNCERIFCAITQPWLKSPDDFTSVVYTAENLPEFKAEILAIDAASKDKDAPRNASEEACQYCKAKAQCGKAVRVAAILALAKIRDLTIEQLEMIGPEIELAQMVVNAWYNRVKYIAEKKPDLLKKYELSEPQQVRQITDGALAFQALRDAEILSKDPEEAAKELISCSKISFNELKIMAATKAGRTQKDAENLVAAALGDLLTKNPKSPSVVPKRKVRA
jgi:hypothetical protein